MADVPKPEEILKMDHRPHQTGWMETPTTIRKGIACYASNPKSGVSRASIPANMELF